jgi:uncharacterized Tic20 family protein
MDNAAGHFGPAVLPGGRLADPLVADGDRTYAALIHLSGFLGYLFGPLVIFITLALWLGRRHDSPFIDDHGREAMNYSISMMIYVLCAGVLTAVAIGCLILPALIIFDIVVMIIAAGRAGRGEYHRYPITIRFIPS